MMFMDVDIALSEVPVNSVPLIDDTDFKTREEAVAYNAAGMELIWHFTTTAGATTATVVTPTTAGVYDWVHQDGAMYTIEIPASGGASINNDTEGFGHFTGFATGVLPWVGPTIVFRAAGLNNLLIDNAYSTTRGLAGTAVPAAAANAAGGMAISIAGGLDLDAKLAATNEITAVRMGALTDWLNGGRLDNLLDAIPTTPMRGTDGGPLASVYTAARAGFLDNLNISENVAGTSEVTAIQNNTRAVRVVPTIIERPDSGSTAYRLELLLYDDVGNMEPPDAAPTITVVNQSGTNRDGNLDATTMTLVSTGRYRSTYTVASSHTIEQLVVTFSVVESGNTRLYGNTSQVVDTTAVDFTSADRAIINAAATAVALATAQSDLDLLTGVDGVTLATLQANYAPIKPTTAGRTIATQVDGSVTNVVSINSGSDTNTNLDALFLSVKSETDLSQGRLMYVPNSPIASVASQTSFVLGTGSDQDDAYNGCLVTIKGAFPNGDRRQSARISDYTGATKTVTLESDPGVFTITTSHSVTIHPPNLRPIDDTVVDAINANVAALENLSQSQAQAAVTAALVAIHLDHLLAAAYDPASKPGAANALLNELIESDAGVSRYTANALEQAPSGGGGGGDATASNQATILARLGAITGSGDNSILGYFLALFRKDAPTPSDIGGTFDPAKHSVEEIRDRGDAAWTAGSGTGLTPLASGTAQAGTASTIQLASGESMADDEPNGNIVKITSGTGAGQSRLITDYVGSTDTATVASNWITAPDATSVYEIVDGPWAWNSATRTLTQTAAQIAAVVSGSAITIHRGDKLSASLTGLGSLTGRTKLWVTVKRRRQDPDANAVLQLIEATGLTILNGSSAVTAGNGSVTVDDAAAGNITIVLNGAETAQLAPARSLHYDVQILDASSEPSTKAEGTLVVNADITRATA